MKVAGRPVELHAKSDAQSTGLQCFTFPSSSAWFTRLEIYSVSASKEDVIPKHSGEDEEQRCQHKREEKESCTAVKR